MWAGFILIIICTMLDLPLGGICYPSLVPTLCAQSGIKWGTNEEIGFAMKVINKGLVEQLKIQNTKKRP